MNAYATPGGPTGTQAGPFVPDRRDWLRLLGGVLFASGALVLLIRKSNDWGNWAQFFALLVPCAVLYGLGFAGRRGWRRVQGWQTAFFAFAILLLPIVLLLFVDAIGGTPGARLNITWVFAAGAAVAVVTALVTGAWWQMLIGGSYAIVAWLALWSKILSNPSGNTVRWLLVAIAAILIVAAVVVGRMRRPGASDLVTAAGIAAVLAGFIELAGLNSSAGSALDRVSNGVPQPSQGWNIYLLVISLALIAYGARSVTRGPAYVGAGGLVAFIAIVGINVVARLKGEDPASFVGWPLLLLLIGAALLVVSFVVRLGPGSGTTEPLLGWPGDRGGQGAAAQPAYGAPPPPAQQPGAPAQPPPQPGAPPPGQGGAGLLDQWRSNPPPGQ
jgi:hypothetical protein